MSRTPDPERMLEIYRTVQNWPGERPGFIARLLGMHRSSVTRILPAMDDRGYILVEDERGGLWPFRMNGGEKQDR
jgi:DNA-binding IclR family transcriptional regulator